MFEVLVGGAVTMIVMHTSGVSASVRRSASVTTTRRNARVSGCDGPIVETPGLGGNVAMPFVAERIVDGRAQSERIPR